MTQSTSLISRRAFSHRHKLYPLVDEIVKCYPQSIVYPFKLSYETLQHSLKDPTLKRQLEISRHKLDRHTPLVNAFIQALNQLNPQQQFEQWSKDLFQWLTHDSAARNLSQLQEHLKAFKETLFSDTINFDEMADEPMSSRASQDSVFGDGIDRRAVKPRPTSIRTQFRNAVEKDLDQLFGKQGEFFARVSLADAKTVLNNLSAKLKSISQDKTNINDYSTWFSSTFRQQQHRVMDRSSARDIEIPGQYTSKKKPCVEQHIKIVGFDEKLLILHSLRVPKRLTIRGHDENEYRFLVKGGEDIRQDQRIQALFTIMNDLYNHDPNAARMVVRTYRGRFLFFVHRTSEFLSNSNPHVVQAGYHRMAGQYAPVEGADR